MVACLAITHWLCWCRRRIRCRVEMASLSTYRATRMSAMAPCCPWATCPKSPPASAGSGTTGCSRSSPPRTRSPPATQPSSCRGSTRSSATAPWAPLASKRPGSHLRRQCRTTLGGPRSPRPPPLTTHLCITSPLAPPDAPTSSDLRIAFEGPEGLGHPLPILLNCLPVRA